MSLKIFKPAFRDFARVLTRNLFVTTIHQTVDRARGWRKYCENSNERQNFWYRKTRD